jgi:ribosome-associated protein
MKLTRQIELAVEAALDKKAQDPVVLDLRGISSFTDHFLICHGTSSRHVQAIADAVEEKLRKAGRRGVSIEGYARADWILMDFIDLVVHIFTAEKREFFNLERLWGDAPRMAFEEAQTAPGRRPAAPRGRGSSTKHRG